MARKSLTQEIGEVVSLEKGKEFAGVFVGSFPIPSKLNKSGETTVHNFKQGDKLVSIFGSHGLDKSLAAATPGAKVYITFVGKKELKTGQTFKQYKVEQDV